MAVYLTTDARLTASTPTRVLKTYGSASDCQSERGSKIAGIEESPS
jgi:hypothetical protein